MRKANFTGGIGPSLSMTVTLGFKLIVDGLRIKMAISNQAFNKTKCVMILSKCLKTCNRSMQVNQKPWPTKPSHHDLEKQTNNQERFRKFSPTLPNQVLLG